MASLDVPAARLYNEAAGSGPAVRRAAGAPADATSFAGLVPHLSRRYTVINGDPRACTRSRLDSAAKPQHVLADLQVGRS
jgi:hypothetical protein